MIIKHEPAPRAKTAILRRTFQKSEIGTPEAT